MKNKRILIIILLLIWNTPLHSSEVRIDSLVNITQLQNKDKDTVKINDLKTAILLGSTIGTFAVTQVYQYKDYWGNRTPFHIMDWKTEYNDALMADKLGHFTFTYGLTKIYANGFEWAGFDRKSSLLYSSLVAFAYQTYVEVQDGHSTGQPYLGFSRGDFIANSIGAIYPHLQSEFETLNNFNFKISFNKSANYEKIGYQNLTMDYESTYHWLTIDLYNLLDENAQSYWSKYVNIAIGHSVNNIDRYGGGNHEIYLSLDWNLEPLREHYDNDNNLLNSILTFISLYKLPAPAVKIYPNVVWYGLRL